MYGVYCMYPWHINSCNYYTLCKHAIQWLKFACTDLSLPPTFIARAKRQTERSANSWSSFLGLPVVQDLLQKIDKFAIAPVRHLLGISDFPPSLNPDIDARGEVRSYHFQDCMGYMCKYSAWWQIVPCACREHTRVVSKHAFSFWIMTI